MSSPESTTRTGSCLCGAVQLKIAGEPMFTNLCHCISCQKATGVVLASIAVFKADQVEYTFSTPDVMKTYSDGSALSGNIIERSFCTVCGSRVKNAAARFHGTVLAVPTGLIDGDKSDLKPKLELFCANREEWLEDIEGAKRFTGMPTPADPRLPHLKERVGSDL